MSYYIIKDGQQQGPFGIDELRTQGIVATTPVWAPGFSNWMKAGDVAELQPLFAQGATTPPPFAGGVAPNPAASPTFGNAGSYHQPYNSAAQPGNGQPCPKTWLVESILVLLFCCLPFGIVGVVFASKVSSLYQQGNYEAAEQASQDAGKWTKIGFFCGLAFIVFYFVLVIGGVISLAELSGH